MQRGIPHDTPATVTMSNGRSCCLAWPPSAPGCLYRVDLIDQSTGRQWKYYEGVGSACELPLTLVEGGVLSYSVWTLDCVPQRTKTALLRSRQLPALDDGGVGRYAAAVAIDVPGHFSASQFRLVIQDAESHETVFDQHHDDDRFLVRKGLLKTGRRYRVRLFGRQSAEWCPISDWELRGGSSIGQPSAEQVVTKLFSELQATNGSRSQGVDGLLPYLSVRLEDDPDQCHQLGYFVFRAWKRLTGGSPGGLDGELLIELARRSSEIDGVSRHMRTALDYLLLWEEARRCFKAEGLDGVRYHDLVRDVPQVENIRHHIIDRMSTLTTDYGALMFKGMLASIRNRPEAASLFAAALHREPDFATAQPLDLFTSMYFTSDDLRGRAVEIQARRRAFEDSAELPEAIGDSSSDATMLLFSCDPVFFAIYFPYWLTAAQYLAHNGIYLHFILVGERSATAAACDSGHELVDAAGRLRGLSANGQSAVSFSTVSLPAYVGDRKTAFAAARYLLAQKVAHRFPGRVLLLDIDMTMRDGPTRFVRQLHELPDGKMPVVASGGVSSLVPSRRFMAGTFLIPTGEFGNQIMSHIEDYTYAGLSSPRSWTLDQNALTYAAERICDEHGADALLDIGRLRRPFVQEPVNMLYEDAHRRLSAMARTADGEDGNH